MLKIQNDNTKRLENTKRSENTKKENNVGKPWTSEEDVQLISEYNSCIHVTEISKIHKRNIGGIMSRLKMLHSNKQTIETYFEKIDKCVGTDKKVIKVRKNITHDIKKLKQTVTELKQTVTELNDMLKALYEFETV
jgi:vacuolar-type H+-ATPase subunit I/STV1